MTNQVIINDLAGIIRRDRARQSRKKRFGEFLGNLIATQFGAALAALLNGWMVMLAVAVAHDHWIPQLPTIGYWWAALIMWLLPSRAPDSSKSDGAR